MADKVYLNATELRKRWGISAQVFATMKKDGKMPVDTVLNKATLFHINDIMAFEDQQRTPTDSTE